MARLVRYVWPTVALAWLVAIAAAGAGSSVGAPAVLLPAILVVTVCSALMSIVDRPDGIQAAGVRMARHIRTATVLRSRDPDAAGRTRPRAPGA